MAPLITHHHLHSNHPIGTLLILISLPILLFLKPCESAKFGFDLHHRFSDQVSSVLADTHLPIKGSVGYFAALVNRDRLRGRRLAVADDDTGDVPVTFSNGNETYRLSSFGFLYYANVTVGTPGLGFLVALDTGSNLFWLPCDCISCVKGVTSTSGQEIDFNIYSLNSSSTGSLVSCNSSTCQSQYTGSCSATHNKCPYELVYLSANTSSIGYLVEDVLHLATDVTPSKDIAVNVTLGCGRIETGSFLEGGAPNGLLGLGIDSISVPSILASENVTANSFSMCFRSDNTGRISFGDQGSSDQSETSFIINKQNPTYNTSITQIIVGSNVTNVGITAIFDTGTSFALLSDPAYTILTTNFDSQVKQEKVDVGSALPFEYCYTLSSCQDDFEIPFVNLTMNGGAQFSLNFPIEVVQDGNQCLYCLAVAQSDSNNIIGENFMTGYHIVFDRDRMILGWTASNCSYVFDTSTLPISPQSSPVSPSVAHAPSSISPSSIGIQATTGASNVSTIPSGGGSSLHKIRLKLCAYALALVVLNMISFL
ncbi:Aspartyl protease family protein 1-like protein [Drosera capensis]